MLPCKSGPCCHCWNLLAQASHMTTPNGKRAEYGPPLVNHCICPPLTFVPGWLKKKKKSSIFIMKCSERIVWAVVWKHLKCRLWVVPTGRSQSKGQDFSKPVLSHRVKFAFKSINTHFWKIWPHHQQGKASPRGTWAANCQKALVIYYLLMCQRGG